MDVDEKMEKLMDLEEHKGLVELDAKLYCFDCLDDDFDIPKAKASDNKVDGCVVCDLDWEGNEVEEIEEPEEEEETPAPVSGAQEYPPLTTAKIMAVSAQLIEKFSIDSHCDTNDVSEFLIEQFSA